MKTKKKYTKKNNRKKIGGDPKANTIDDGTLPIFKSYFQDDTRLKDILYNPTLYSRLIIITPNLSIDELLILFFTARSILNDTKIILL